VEKGLYLGSCTCAYTGTSAHDEVEAAETEGGAEVDKTAVVDVDVSAKVHANVGVDVAAG
jgi:hypothetical protein